jgi:preprotein translocase subunit SecA/nephrocystin-3
VEKEFAVMLDELFPFGELSNVEKERIGQRSFMNQLCQNYIRDEKYFNALNDWMDDWTQHQLVVTGASGLGKSALIANWLKEKLQDTNREYNIIYHFTGNGGSAYKCSSNDVKVKTRVILSLPSMEEVSPTAESTSTPGTRYCDLSK